VSTTIPARHPICLGSQRWPIADVAGAIVRSRRGTLHNRSGDGGEQLARVVTLAKFGPAPMRWSVAVIAVR